METPLNIFQLTDTFTLLSAIEQIETPINFLTDKFFSPKLVLNTDYVAVEYRAEHRILAPALSENNSRGVDINRGGSKIKYYRAMRFGARRTIGLGDLKMRMFGEVPNLYSPVSVESRQARMQAQDLAELMKLFANRREQMCAEVLQTGKIKINAYSEDGIVEELDEVNYDWDGLIQTDWTSSSATIYDDLLAVSERIQRRCGIIPTVAICGRNVEKYLLNNTELMKYLMVPLRENMTFSSWAPTWTSPEIRYIGRVQAANMEFYSYAKVYMDDTTNTVKPYIEDDTVLICVGNIGKTVYTPVTVFDEGTGFHTIAAPIVPRYTSNKEAQTLALSLFSNFIIVPDLTSMWVCLKVKP